MEENTFLKMPAQSQMIVMFDKIAEIADKIDNIETKIDRSDEKLSAKIETLDKKISRKKKIDFVSSSFFGVVGGFLAIVGKSLWPY